MSTPSPLSSPVHAAAEPLAPLRLGERLLDWSRLYLMGVLNVTPDSFSDGGRYLEPSRAVEQGLALARDGAYLLDVGGESTRPGADPVGVAEEISRVVPVVEGLAQTTAVPISVDTYKAEVAAAACAAGATLVNDVSGLTMDPELPAAVAEAGAALVIGHIRGTPRTMQEDVSYKDVLAEVADALEASRERALASGVAAERILVDPGVGFGKSVAGNLTLMGGAGALRERLGCPVLLGPSRKSFIGAITGAEVSGRLPGTLAALVAGRIFGADMVRVHDVVEARQAALITDALLERVGRHPGGAQPPERSG